MERAARIGGILVGLVLSAVGVGTSVYFAGGGHGTYVPAVALFPLPMLTTLVTNSVITPVAMALAVVQFPAVGFVAASAHPERRARVLIALALLHVMLVITGFIFLGNGAFM